MSDVPYDLSIDGGGDQFPVAGPSPRLSWKPVANTTAYRVQMSVGGDQSEVTVEGAGVHRFLEWPWRPLRSAERVAWRVAAAPDGEWSPWHEFEAGLFDPDWTARWISPPEASEQPAGTRPAHVLTTTFELSGTAPTARLYATALGLYEVFVNGVRAGTAELTPGTSAYEHTVYAQAYDVTANLTTGTNTLEIVLSDGWYHGRFGAFRRPVDWGPTVAARAELHLRLDDGTRRVVATDGAWTARTSQIVRADLMDGQTSDLTVAPSGRQPVLIDEVVGPTIAWSPAPPVRCIEERPVEEFTRLDSGAWIADFGQNASGWLALSNLGPAGTRTVIEHGEHLGADGDLDTTHLDGVDPGQPPMPFVQRDEVVSDGSDASFEPRHTVHGFRYARIEREGPLDASDLTMRVVHTDLRPTGTFECSNPDLTRLFEVARWSFRGNAVDIPTDCPTRERLGWTGDYQVFAPTATRMYDVLGFSRKWLQAVRDDQLDDGRIANYSPDGRRIKHHLDDLFAILTGSAGWGDAIVLVPWELYRAYGARHVLAENWDAMVRWVEWALHTARTQRHASRIERSTEPQPHEEYLWDGSFHWGEWCEPQVRDAEGKLVDPVMEDPGAWFGADKAEVGTAFLYKSTSTLARIAEVLGYVGEAARFAAIAGRVRDAWTTEFVNADGTTTVDTQANYVRALSLGLAPDDLRPRAATRLVELVRAADNHLTTGFLATADLLPALADSGHADVAYDLLFQRTSPSWLGMLDRGATTIWEHWDGVDTDGSAQGSLNHYSKGAVAGFLHSHTLGLRQQPGSVAWERLVVAPLPHADITWARGSLDTPQGMIEVDWRVEGDELAVTVEVPPGASADIIFPDGDAMAAGPGRQSARQRLRG